MKTRLDVEEIKEAVREHYGKVARSATESACCGTTSSACCTENQAGPYSAQDLAAVPVAAVTSSRGCGNPLALVSLMPGEVVLDLGAGGGMDVLLAAQRVGPQGFVYGLDMTDEMLELARRNAQKAGATNVAFIKGEIEKIPLPDASVDVIISNCVINLSPDKAEALGEAFRVLRPGGRLAVSDIVIDGDLTELPLSEEKIREALSWVGCIGGALTMREYRQFLEAAGFESVALEVKHLYSIGDVASLVPRELLVSLAPRVLEDLVRRFTSSAITARRPR